jgi:hypothetical protein
MLPTEDQYGFIDAADWQSIKSQGSKAIERWIDKQLENTTVTAVLVGAETASRGWVLHEILQSWNRGNGIVVIRIHNIKDQDKKTDMAGSNPLNQFKLPNGTLLSSVFKVYDWVTDDGRNNLGKWAEEAVKLRIQYPADCKITAIAEPEPKRMYAVAGGSISTGFSPKAPWCPDDADKRR